MLWRRPRKYLVLLGIVLLIGWFYVSDDDAGKADGQLAVARAEADRSVTIVLVSCGAAYNGTLSLLTSVLTFSNVPINFYVFANTPDLRAAVQAFFQRWRPLFLHGFTYHLLEPSFPSQQGDEQVNWMRLYKECAMQRLFLPDVLSSVDAVLYLDTDTLVTTCVSELWVFKAFNESQLAAMASEHETEAVGWYNRFARHPFYGRTGLNSGVMAMNLTRMRLVGWVSRLTAYYKQHRLNLAYHDQDLLNVYFHDFPEQLFLLDCSFNFRPDHCIYGLDCAAVRAAGARLIHGNRGAFYADKYPVFRAISRAFNSISAKNRSALYPAILQSLSTAERTSYCGQSLSFALKRLRFT